MFKGLYDLSKRPSFHNELKKELDPTLEFDTLNLVSSDPLDKYKSKQYEYDVRIATEFTSIRASLNHRQTLGKRGI